MSKVAVIDYGVGNLLNVLRAFRACHIDAEVVDDPLRLKDADRVVLPGVGAYRDGILELTKRGFVPEIKNYLTTQRPFLGICLGMQLLLDESEEFGRSEGLGLISGKVVKIPDFSSDGKPHKVPHIGWNSLLSPSGGKWNQGLLNGIDVGASVYFVHSYMAQPTNSEVITSTVDYGGIQIPATLQLNNIYAAQFHPERSAEFGLKILKNFSA